MPATTGPSTTPTPPVTHTSHVAESDAYASQASSSSGADSAKVTALARVWARIVMPAAPGGALNGLSPGSATGYGSTMFMTLDTAIPAPSTVAETPSARGSRSHRSPSHTPTRTYTGTRTPASSRPGTTRPS